MKPNDEKGVALVLVMIMLAVLSIIAASLMAVSTGETSASMNYRLMTLARYGGESAVHKAANYLMSATYSATAPGSATDPIGNYNMNATPVMVNGQAVTVTRLGQPVVLSADAGTASNYPVEAVVTAFKAAATGTLTGGSSPVSYNAVATLVSMRQINVFGGTSAVVQTWQITGTGILAGIRPAEIEVSSILERQVTPVFSYAAFATSSGCGALDWQGNAKTDSYNSAVGHVPDVPAFGGNVGTNGNLTLTGGAEINGTLSTIRTGVGSCAAGNALTGSLSKVDGMVELPQAVVYPTPAPPATLSNVPKTLNPGNTLVLAPGDYGDLDPIKGTLKLSAGTYNINSISMTSQGTIDITSGPVILNVAGYATAGVYEAVPSRADPVTMYGGAFMNVATYDPSMFRITYAGTKTINLLGTSGITGLIYAPNATVTNGGTVDWYGAIIAAVVKDFGNASIHYDRALATKDVALGAFMLDSFTWRKY